MSEVYIEEANQASVNDRLYIVGDEQIAEAADNFTHTPQALYRIDTIDNTYERNKSDALGIYLKGISQFPLLSREQEIDLAKNIEKGREAQKVVEQLGEKLSDEQRATYLFQIEQGQVSKQDFINSNLRLVVSIAKKFYKQNSKLELLDLIQEGNLGMEHAVDKFEWQKGFKFSTYATWWIKQSIRRGVANSGRTVRLPVHEHERQGRLAKAEGQGLSDAQIMEQEGWSPHILELVRHSARIQPISMDAPLANGYEEFELGDTISDPTSLEDYANVESQLASDAVHEALKSILLPREAELLRLRFGIGTNEPHTLDGVGRLLGITKEYVRQLESNAKLKLKHPSAYKSLEKLVIEAQPESENWKSQANCKNKPTSMFFNVRRDKLGRPPESEKINPADDPRVKICASCVVRQECLNYAKAERARLGWWGGVLFNKTTLKQQ